MKLQKQSYYIYLFFFAILLIDVKCGISPQQQLINQALSENSFVYDRLAFMCDNFGNRLSGSDNLENAIDWLKNQILIDGLDVVQESVTIPKWVRGNEWAKIVSPFERSIHILGLGMSIGTSTNGITAEIFVVSNFTELELNPERARGKIVVFNVPFTTYGETVQYRSKGPAAAAKVGAVAALVRSVTPFSLQSPHTGSSIKTTIPGASITIEDAEMLQRFQDRNQRITIQLYMEAKQVDDVPSRNLVITWPGSTYPDEYVVIGGHIDSWDVGQGAVDDGAGAFICWEAVRMMKILGLRPKRTVRMVFFVNEENGSRGGSAYYTDHISEMNRTSIAIESDMGAFTPWGIGFSGEDSALPILRSIGTKYLSSIGSGNVTTPGSGTDISYMCNSGVPCSAFIVLDPFTGKPPPPGEEVPDGYFYYHHTAADTMTALDPTELQLCAASMAVWAYSIADLDTLLPRF
eukprot:TRINITY_DN562_c1_g1_i1.p1 TRINITY_DN562_c1_g1~~TRINITY_DN562_c1_g1_i1.p1  ORF type:complete len:488 (-),score=262.36 TRINITY_DN562_c1_g1_i1:41-1429(-)